MRPELGYEEQVHFYRKRGSGLKDALVIDDGSWSGRLYGLHNYA